MIRPFLPRARAWGPTVGLVAVLALSLPTGLGAQGVPAKVELKSGVTWDVVLLGRDERRWVFLRQKDQQAEIGYPLSEFVKVEFPFDAAKEAGDLEAFYRRGDYGRVTLVLEPLLKPLLRFLDLPGNALPYARLYLRCLYFDGRYQDALTWSHALVLAHNEAVTREAQVFRALAKLGLGFIPDAETELGKLDSVAATNQLGAAYWYAQSRLALARKQWAAASEIAARAIVFQSKSFEWLPPLLLASAEAHDGLGERAVAAQIAAEVQMMVPGTRWADRAAAAQKVYGPAELPPDKPPAPTAPAPVAPAAPGATNQPPAAQPKDPQK